MLTWIDWIIVLVPLLIVVYAGWRHGEYVRGVSDFLAGGRVAGRYVLRRSRCGGIGPDQCHRLL